MTKLVAAAINRFSPEWSYSPHYFARIAINEDVHFCSQWERFPGPTQNGTDAWLIALKNEQY
jgi:hypothetical protein